MNNDEIRVWEGALDQAEREPLMEGLPSDAKVGDIYKDEEHARRWIRVNILYGNVGSRWAYWARMVDGQNSGFDAVADRIFNGDAAHFVGMLAVPYVKMPGQGGTPMWVLVEPRMVGPKAEIRPMEPVKERYERSKEVFDVESGKSERLP